jgi:hypothetical protein
MKGTNMNWKVWLHSAAVALASILAGAVEQYFKTGGVIPQTDAQWRSFAISVGSTILIGIAALLKQSPLPGSITDPGPGGVQGSGTVATYKP